MRVHGPVECIDNVTANFKEFIPDGTFLPGHYKNLSSGFRRVRQSFVYDSYLGIVLVTTFHRTFWRLQRHAASKTIRSRSVIVLFTNRAKQKICLALV